MTDWKGWTKVAPQVTSEGEVHDFEKEPVLKGLFVEKLEGVGPNASNMYIVENEKHDKVKVWGNTVLDTRLKNLVPGDEVGIEYLGMEKSPRTGRSYKNFDVFVKHNGDPLEDLDLS